LTGDFGAAYTGRRVTIPPVGEDSYPSKEEAAVVDDDKYQALQRREAANLGLAIGLTGEKRCGQR
jgi:hypothetical protein